MTNQDNAIRDEDLGLEVLPTTSAPAFDPTWFFGTAWLIYEMFR